MKKSFFVHIPKNAGTSVESFLKESYGSRMCETYWEGALLGRNNSFFQKYDFFSGHMLFNVYDLLGTEFFVFTFIRDPLKRALSTYNYVKTKDDLGLHEKVKGLDFEAWLNHPKYSAHLLNHQLRYFGSSLDFKQLFKDVQRQKISLDNAKKIIGHEKLRSVTKNDLNTALSRINKISFIGQVERFDESMKVLTALLECPEHYMPTKVNVTHKSLLKIEDLSDEVIEKFKFLSSLEYEFVDVLRKVSNAQIDSFETI